MKVGEIMTDYVLATSLETRLRAAKRAMEQHSIRHLPVVDDGQVIGMISQRELASAATVAHRFGVSRDSYEHFLDTPVRDFLQTRFAVDSDVLLVSPTAPLTSAIDMLLEHRLSALPVVDDNGELIGIISYVDILQALRGQLDD